MKQLLEWSGMWTILTGVIICGLGIIVLIINDDLWFMYALGYLVIGVGLLMLFWSVLRDRLRARKTDNLDDVGYN